MKNKNKWKKKKSLWKKFSGASKFEPGFPVIIFEAIMAGTIILEKNNASYSSDIYTFTTPQNI
jgi:hypothetical protein